MTTGLQRDIHRACGKPASAASQCIDLGMCATCATVITAGDDRAIACDHATYPRIGSGGVKPQCREADRLGHQYPVFAVPIHGSALWRGEFFFREALDLGTEFIQILEAAVHGSKTHECDVIDCLELLHHFLPHHPGRHLAFA